MEGARPQITVAHDPAISTTRTTRRLPNVGADSSPGTLRRSPRGFPEYAQL